VKFRQREKLRLMPELSEFLITLFVFLCPLGKPGCWACYKLSKKGLIERLFCPAAYRLIQFIIEHPRRKDRGLF
jgi:hypothetical protein